MSCLLAESRRVGFGATGYSGAMVRLSHIDSTSIAAAGMGLQRYTQLEFESERRTLLFRCGHLYFGTVNDLQDILAEVQNFTPSACILDCDEILYRFPGMSVTAEAALYEPDAGYADPITLAKLYCAKGIYHGGTLAEATHLHRLIFNDGSVTGAQTSQGDVSCQHVVLATGMQTPLILESHNLKGPNLWAQLIQVSQFRLSQSAQNWPGFIDDALGLNGLPGIGYGRYYVGLPTHERIAAELTEARATPQHSARTRDVAKRRLPALSDAYFQGAMCHPDCYSDSLVCEIGPLEDGPNGLCLATGFGGGGFKMAPYAAERITQLFTNSFSCFEGLR